VRNRVFVYWQNSRFLPLFRLVFSSNPYYFNNMNKKYDIIAFEGFYTLNYKVDRDPLSLIEESYQIYIFSPCIFFHGADLSARKHRIPFFHSLEERL